jgi:A/G-specific adenine glycosylase
MPRSSEFDSRLPDADWLARFRRRLRSWYARHARDLPWRRHGDPYPVWVSEIMLQQTQVETVRPYFARFLAAFPSIAALAAADTQRVLRLWEGLGYYRRARQLHEAARLIVKQHGGVFPRDPRLVRSLPGIGRYTAGAILSIAFDAREPILEANTVRLHARLLAYPHDPLAKAGQDILWRMAEAVLPRRDPGRFNQALMEIGSLVCLPRNPLCETCPVAPLCATRREGRQNEIPRPKAKPRMEDIHEVAVVIRRGGRVLLMQCPEGRRWAGLWDFPRYAVQADDGPALHAELADHVRRELGLAISVGQRLVRLKHGVTRFRITLDGYAAKSVGRVTRGTLASPQRWVRPGQLDQYPLSTTGRKIGHLLQVE